MKSLKDDKNDPIIDNELVIKYMITDKIYRMFATLCRSSSECSDFKNDSPQTMLHYLFV